MLKRFKKFIFLIIIMLCSSAAFAQQVVILLGPPGSGKGSQATMLSVEQKLPHLSTGDLLRENIRTNTPLGKQAKQYLDKGELVPDNLIIDLIFKRTAQKDCEPGYILDGFPRTLPQAEELKKRLNPKAELTVINLEIQDQTIIERLSNRLVCPDCGAPYNLIAVPPKKEGTCDRCNGKLVQRSDDKKEVIEQRLAVYHKQTAPLIAYYTEKGLLRNVNSEQAKEKTQEEILSILSKEQVIAPAK